MDRDTSEDARRRQLEVLRGLGGVGRLARAFEMSEDARALSASGMCLRHPEISRAQAERRVLRRVLGPQLFEAAYGSAGG